MAIILLKKLLHVEEYSVTHEVKFSKNRIVLRQLFVVTITS